MTKTDKRNRFVWLSLLSIQVLLLAITVARLYMTRQAVLGMDECISCQAITMIQHEAGLWALVWLLLALASWSFRPLRWLCVAVVWSLIMILVADVMTLQQFSLRLFLTDIFKFGQQPVFIIEYLQNLLGWFWIPLAAIAIIGLPWLMLFTLHRHLSTPPARLGLLAMCILSALLYTLPDKTAHALPWTYLNLLEANWPSGTDEPYSQAYIDGLLAEPPAGLATEICEAGLATGGDVIIVAIESLSWYHSSLVLPVSMEATPQLDALARENSWWDHFYSNGFTTDHGLIAMLAGQLPVPAVNRYRSMNVFNGYEAGAASLTQRLARDGYYSAFLTSGHLAFLGKGEWLHSLGFDHVEGHDQAEYDDAERFEFSAVGDELLYRRVVNWLKNERPGDQPVVAFVETVTTHPPFVDPDTRQVSEAAAFRYADRSLAGFIRELEAMDYFRDGLLIITSDQRALTPVRPAEMEAFGQSAGARLPLIMLGDRLPLRGRQSTAAQMSDLPFSLDYYLSDEACHLPGQGNLFTAQAPECIYQADGNQRSIINAFCADQTASIRMDGDQTAVIKGQLPDEQRRIRELNYLRARLGIRDVDIHIVL
jgi:lipoteichoic acid synthase